MAEGKKELSILAVVQKMVEAGEPREKIIATLHELGVTRQQAERLMLVGEARTFRVLEKEIAKIAQDQVEQEKPRLQAFVRQQTAHAEAGLKKALHGMLRLETERVRSALEERLKALEEFSASVENRAEKNEERLARLESEVRKIEVRGLGARNEWVRLLLVIGGVAFMAASVYLFFVESAAPTLDSLIRAIVIALTGVTMLFGSTLV